MIVNHFDNKFISLSFYFLDMLQLTPGKKFRVIGFHKTDNRAYRHKLLAMGFMLGSVFKVLRVAPLGDPIEVEVKGFLLSLRNKECQIMKLEPVHG